MSRNPFKAEPASDRTMLNRLALRVRNLERRITGDAPVTNDWVLAQVALGTVATATSVDGAMTGSIVKQTDDGSVYAVGDHAIDTIDFLQIGSYLVRARFTFAESKTGYGMGSAVIGGPVTTYDYDLVRFMPLSVPDTAGPTIMGKYGGQTIWEQLCVVNDLSAPAGAYLTFENLDGPSLISVVGQLQVFRLT